MKYGLYLKGIDCTNSFSFFIFYKEGSPVYTHLIDNGKMFFFLTILIDRMNEPGGNLDPHGL